MADLDFAGLAEQARAAFKPHYADVVARARRRRRNARAVAALLTIAVVAAGGAAAYAISDRRSIAPIHPAPTSIPSYIQVGPPMSPQPTWTLIDPKLHGWDVTEPDTPLTGMFPMMLAGDMHHLYLEYQNCKGSGCVHMVTASADGGRTWRKFRLPDGSVIAASGATVVAAAGGGGSAPTYFTSVDGGATWQVATPRPVTALPAGWPLLDAGVFGDLWAFDPATGNVAVLHPKPEDPGASRGAITLIYVPRSAGIWQLRTGPSTYLAVSHDGGATWQNRTFPHALLDACNCGPGTYANLLTTADGKTLVGVAQEGDNLRLYISHDGALTWKLGAEITNPVGPLQSLLSTSEGPILIEVGNDAYRSTDGGTTVQRVGSALGWRAHVINGGYAEVSNDARFSIWLSADGGTWTFISRPPLP